MSPFNREQEHKDRFITSLEAIGVPRHLAETAANEPSIMQHGEGAFRRIQSNPSLLPPLPLGADTHIKNALYSKVENGVHSAITGRYVHPAIGEHLLNQMTTSQNSQERDSAYGQAYAMTARLNMGSGAKANAQREYHQVNAAVKLLQSVEREVLQPLADHHFDNGQIVIDPGYVFVGNQPHVRVGIQDSSGTRISSTLVTATKTGEYKDANGKIQDRRQLYADNRPLLPEIGLVKDENGNFKHEFGFNSYRQTNNSIEPNVFKPISDIPGSYRPNEPFRPGNLAYQRTAAWNILAGGGNPTQIVGQDKRGVNRLYNANDISQRMSYMSKSTDSDDVVSPRNFGDFYSGTAESTQNKVALHPGIGIEERLGLRKDEEEAGQMYSQRSMAVPLGPLRFAADNGTLNWKEVDPVVRSWINKKNPVTGEFYDTVASPAMVLGSSWSSRNGSYGALKPIPDAFGKDYDLDANGNIVTAFGTKGGNKGQFQKNLKVEQLDNRPVGVFYNRETGDELPVVSSGMVRSAYGNSGVTGNLLNAAIINYGSTESDGGALVSRSLGIQTEATFKYPKGFESEEFQRLNNMAGQWIKGGRDTWVNPGTDQAREFSGGFNQAFIRSVENIEGSDAVRMFRRDTPFATDRGGTKAFGIWSNRTKDYNADIVYNKINDTQAFMFNALNSLASADPNEYRQLMQSQFNPELRRQYLSGNDQLNVNQMLEEKRQFTWGKRHDWSKPVQWNQRNEPLLRSAFQDLYARHTREEEHTVPVANDFLPMFASSRFLTPAQRAQQSQYYGSQPIPDLVTNVQPLAYNDAQSLVTIRQSVTRLPLLTMPEAHVPGQSGKVSAMDALGLTRESGNDSSVIERLNRFGVDKSARKADILRTAALNEGANIGGLSEFLVGTSISPSAAEAYRDATNSIDPASKNQLQQKLQLYHELILGGKDLPTLVRSGEGRGAYLPSASSLLPMINGTEDEFAGKEVSSIIDALHSQVSNTILMQKGIGNGSIKPEEASRAISSLSQLAARESTRDLVTGRSGDTASYMSVGGDAQMPLATAGVSDEDYETYIHKNLKELGHDLSIHEVRGLIRSVEDKFVGVAKDKGMRAALDQGILPVAGFWRSPNMSLNQRSFSSLISQTLATRMGLSSTEFQNGQIITPLADQMAQKGDFDKDDLTRSMAFIKYDPEMGLQSTVKPTLGSVMASRALDPTDPAAQGKTWLEINSTDYAGKSASEIAKLIANKQTVPITGQQRMSEASAITTLSKKQMGQMFNMTLEMRAWYRAIGGKAGKNGAKALLSEEQIRAFEYQTVLDTNPIDPSGSALSKLKNGAYKGDISKGLIQAFLQTDPKSRKVSSADIARMLVPVDSKYYDRTVGQVSKIIDEHWEGKSSLEEASDGIHGFFTKKDMSVGYGNTFASFFTGSQLLNKYLREGEGAHPDQFFAQFGGAAERFKALANHAASIRMMVGTGNLFGSGDMSAKDVMEALSHNSQFFPGDDNGNSMLQGTVARLGVEDALGSPLERLAQMGNASGQGVDFDFSPYMSSSGNGAGNGDDQPPINFDDYEPPPDPDEGWGGEQMDALTQNYQNGSNPLGGQPPTLPGSRMNSGGMVPPAGLMPTKSGANARKRFQLNASALTLRGVLATLSGANNLMSGPEAEFGRRFSRPAEVQSVLHSVLGLPYQQDQDRRTSMYYNPSNSQFEPGLKWTAKNGKSVWIHGDAAYVNDDAIWNLSFGKANQSPDDRKQREMQMFAYMQRTGVRKANVAHFDIDAFQSAYQEGGSRESLLAAYASAHNALPADQRVSTFDYSSDEEWNRQKTQFDSQMEENMPYVEAFANAQRKAFGTDFYTTSEGKFDGSDERHPAAELLSHQPADNTPAGIQRSLDAMQGVPPVSMNDVLHPAVLARMKKQGQPPVALMDEGPDLWAGSGVQPGASKSGLPPVPPNVGGSGSVPPSGSTPPSGNIPLGDPLGSKYNPITASQFSVPSRKKTDMAYQRLTAGGSIDDVLSELTNMPANMTKKQAERVVRASTYVDTITGQLSGAESVIYDANNGVDVPKNILERATAVAKRYSGLRSSGVDANGDPNPPTAFENISTMLGGGGLAAHAAGVVEANKTMPAAPKASQFQASSLTQPADFAGQVSAMPGVNKQLEDMTRTLSALGNSAKTASVHAESLTTKQEQWIVRTGKATDQMIKSLQEAQHLATGGDLSASDAIAQAESLGIWSNGKVAGGLAERAKLLFGEEDASGKRGGGLYNVAVARRAGFSDTPEDGPDFRDKLAPFLMGGRAGRKAREEADKEGWYGEQGSAENLAWKVGGTAIGAANRGILGFRMFRNMASELVAPLQADAQFYQQTEAANNRSMVQYGLSGINQVSASQGRTTALANAQYTQQRNIGQNFEMAWNPLMQTAATQGGGTLSELAAIGGPALAAGMAASFVTGGNPVAGAVVGGIAAGAGIAGLMSSTLSDDMTRAKIAGDLANTNPQSAAQKNGYLKTTAVQTDEFIKWIQGRGGENQKDQNVGNAVKAFGSGDSAKAASLLAGTGYVTTDKNGAPQFSSDILQAGLQDYLANNQDALKNVPAALQTAGLAQAVATYGMPSAGNAGKINQMIKTSGMSAMYGVDTSAYTNMLPAARGMMDNAQDAVGAMSSIFEPYNTGSASDLPVFANMAQRAMAGVGFAARRQRVYGKQYMGLETAAALYGGSDVYTSADTANTAAGYLENTGVLDTYRNTNIPGSGNPGYLQGLGERTRRVTDAGLLDHSEAVAQANAINAGENRDSVNTMNKYRIASIDDTAGALHNGVAAAMISQADQAKIYAAQANIQAAQGGVRPFTQEQFSGLRTENAQALVGAGAIIAAQGASGLGIMTNTVNAIGAAYGQNTDAGLALGNQLTGQLSGANQMYQSWARYGGATTSNRAAMDQIAATTDPQKYSRAMAIAGGDTRAISGLFENNITADNMQFYTVQGDEPSQSAGMPAFYDRAVPLEVGQARMSRGIARNELTSYKGNYGDLSPLGYSQMSDVQRESFANMKQMEMRNTDFDFANRGLERSQAATHMGWNFEDQGIAINRAQQDYQYQMQGQNLALSEKEASYSYSYQKQNMGIERSHQVQEGQWHLEDLAFQRNQSEVSFGFNMIDAEESIRYSTGRQKRVAMRHRDEAVVMQSMNMGQMDKEEDRAKERLKWADDQFNREKTYFEQNRQFQLQHLQLAQQSHQKEREFQLQERALQDQKIAYDRKISQEEMDDMRKSLAIHQQFQITMDNIKGSASTAQSMLTEYNAAIAFNAASGLLASMAVASLNSNLGNVPGAISQVTAAINSLVYASISAGNVSTGSGGGQGGGGGTGYMYDLGGYVGLPSYAGGGYTGSRNSKTPAGVVHGHEWVVPENGALVVRGGMTDEKLDKINSTLERILEDGGNAMVQVNMSEPQRAIKHGLNLYNKSYGSQ